MVDGWPLVGRSDLLLRIARTARSARWAGVVLVGPSGVGRTRLARAALAAVVTGPDVDGGPATGRWTPSWVMASSATSRIPLGALAHLLPDLDPDRVPGARLLREARRHLTGGPDTDRLILAVDDAHLLDETSAVLLQQLVVSGDAFVVVTAPTGVDVPAPIFALWKEGLADRIDIAALERGDVDRLVVAALCRDGSGEQVDHGALDRMWRLSLGNVQLLRELVEGGRASGSLRRVGSVWRWDGPLHATARLVEMVSAQMGAPDEDEHDLLRLLAFGQPLDSEVATRLVAGSVVESAERGGLVISRERGTRLELSLAHPLHAEILRGEVTPLQVREIYHRLSDAAAAIGPREDADRRQMLSWQVAQGRHADLGELVPAALDLRGRDPDLAGRMLAAATEQDGSFRARLRLGDALVLLGRHHDAEAVLARLGEDPELRVPGPDSLDRAVDVATIRARNLYWGLRDLEGADAVLAEVEARTGHVPGPPGLTALRAFRTLIAGSPAESVRVVAPAVADGTDDTLPALAVAALSAVKAGLYAAAADFSRRAEALPDIGDGAGGWLRFEVLAARWYADLQSGNLDAADALAGDLYARSVADGLVGYTALYSTWLGIVAGRRGRPVTAARRLLEAAASVPAGGFSFTMPLVSELAIALAGIGATDRAHAVIAEGQAAAGEMLLGGWVYAAQVFVAGAGGRSSQAAERALDAATRAETHGHRMQALHTAVRLGLTGEVTDRLSALARDAEGALARVYGAHAQALAARDGHALDGVAAGFDELGLVLLAAEAAAQAAAAHRAVGNVGSAGSSATRARAWAGECEGARTPALALLDGPDELTPREREIASLAATGMTSKAIASELVVSVRTVDNVLRSVYAKLGVSGRGDLHGVVGIRGRR